MRRAYFLIGDIIVGACECECEGGMRGMARKNAPSAFGVTLNEPLQEIRANSFVLSAEIY